MRSLPLNFPTRSRLLSGVRRGAGTAVAETVPATVPVMTSVVRTQIFLRHLAIAEASRPSWVSAPLFSRAPLQPAARHAA